MQIAQAPRNEERERDRSAGPSTGREATKLRGGGDGPDLGISVPVLLCGELRTDPGGRLSYIALGIPFLRNNGFHQRCYDLSSLCLSFFICLSEHFASRTNGKLKIYGALDRFADMSSPT